MCCRAKNLPSRFQIIPFVVAAEDFITDEVKDYPSFLSDRKPAVAGLGALEETLLESIIDIFSWHQSWNKVR